MRKDYFMKNLLAASMLLAVSVGMSSCSGFVDAVLGTSDTPTTQPTTQPTTSSAVVTADQTTITISSLEDMANAVSAEQNEQFLNAIKAKAAAGEEYTINIKSEQPLSTNSFEGLVIPRVEGSNINIVFDKPLVTTEASPLKITAEEKKSATPTTAVDELTITLPDGSDNVCLSVDMPETTVTLAGNITYKYVEAITATNTLVVGNGVTIKEYKISDASLQYKIDGGIAVVKTGGAIETLVYPAGIFWMGITSKGLLYADTPDLAFHIIIVKDEKGDPYIIPNLKIVKGDADYVGLYHDCLPIDCDGDPWLNKLTIGDGAVVRNMNYTVVPYEEIIGEGNATFLYGYNMKELGFNDNEMKDLSFFGVESISNVTFKPKYAEGTALSNIPSNTEGCKFIADNIWMFADNYNSTLYTAKNNVYEYQEPCWVVIPGQSDVITSFKYDFQGCTFSDNNKLYVDMNTGKAAFNDDGSPVMCWVYSHPNGTTQVLTYDEIPEEYRGNAWQSQYIEPITFDNYKGTIVFNNCKYGSASITKDTNFLMRGYGLHESVIDLKFIIDGTTYGYTYDDQQNLSIIP